MRLNFDNRGGLCHVFAIPAECVSNIRNNWNRKTVTPELISNSGIIKLPYYAGQNYSFTEQHSLNEQGDLYAVEIKGIIPSQLIEDIDINTLQRGEWLVIHQDARGIIRLSGTKLIPLRFSSTRDTGTELSNPNGEEFVFSATEAEPSPECDFENFNNL